MVGFDSRPPSRDAWEVSRNDPRAARILSRGGFSAAFLALSLCGWSDKAHAKKDFSTENGEVDPRKTPLPRPHRFRLALTGSFMRLSLASTPEGESQRFYFAPLLLDMAYQAQFLKYMMFRAGLGVGVNASNSIHAMPAVLQPQALIGYQGGLFGIAAGYAYILAFPLNKDATDGRASSIGEPILVNNQAIQAEISFTSRVDRVAFTLSLGFSLVNSTLRHFDTEVRRWRPMPTLGLGLFFDGSIRRAKREEKSKGLGSPSS